MNTVKTKGRPVRGSAPRGRRRAAWMVAAVLLLAVGLGLWYYLERYYLNDDYKACLSEHAAAETGRDFTPLAEAESAVPGFKLVAQNDVLKLYAKADTGEVAVHDLRTGKTVYTNPTAADEDPVANKTNRNYLKSQFVLDYVNKSGTMGTYDSFSMSVERDQMTCESIEDGVRFVYDVGEKPQIDFYVPFYLSTEKYGELRSQMDADGQAQLDRVYTFNESRGLYEIIKAGRTSRTRRMKTDELLQTVGFTPEEYYEQMALGGEAQPEPLMFTIALEYRLKNDGLEVTMPVSAMQESGGGQIYRVQLLRYMGAAGCDEDGYLVTPNGSGALIRFNNGRNNTAIYSQYVYGMDLVDADYNLVQQTVPVRLPIYGICREDASLLVSIEKGASLAMLTGDVAGRYNSYNYMYPSFVLRGYGILSMFGVNGTDADIPVMEKKLYDTDVTVRYTLLTDEYAGYSGLARYYRDRLIAEGTLTPKAENGDIPFYYDVIGGVKETAHTLGVQYLRVKPMTTFNQAEEMARTLQRDGISRQVMNFQGWMNGGYYHDVPDRISPLWELGGKKGLAALDKTVTDMGSRFYADAALQKVTAISKRYLESSETSRYYGAGYIVQLGQVNPGNLHQTSPLGYYETIYNLLSPKFLPRYAKGFASAAEKLHLSGISLRDLGDDLHADKRRTEVISREEALDVVRAQLNILDGASNHLMVSGGNDYAFGVAEDIVNAPTSATEYFLVDETIPLYEMIVHGCIDYAGAALNTSVSDSRRADVLHLIEYGAAPHYIFTWQDATEMKYTGLNRYFATTFSAWKDEALETYAYMNGALKSVSGAMMLSHDVLPGGIKRVCYDNGVTLYINQSSTNALADGYTVPAMDYLVVGGVAP